MTEKRHPLMDSLQRLYNAGRAANLPAETHEVLSRDADAIGRELFQIANPPQDVERGHTGGPADDSAP